ncbi:DHA2 family efflux MFS transporter permease subunit [Cysteiniphilum halobium]|uniref:DHA2 family efflux MFS transporter permease subunit n=1 Tax=Cysteiniphilum halobium TaxID=2219059 RepID=UPI000E64FA3E|nr:DHA2 family efflux MFS transporter permease subunit [Cysteiniphilum halobium]
MQVLDSSMATIRRVVPLIVAVVIFMEFLDLTIINTAIPSIARDFSINPILLKFSVASYYISLAIFIPISGWCADRFGTKRVFLFAVMVFTLSSLACGLSNSVVMLTVCRFLQGVGGAFMNPVARIIILRLFSRKELIKVQSIIFTPAMLGYVLGPFVGGVICDSMSWHWIFFINLPIGCLALVCGFIYIQQHVAKTFRRFDMVGFLIAGFALVVITFGVEMIGHYDIVSKGIVYTSIVIGILLLLMLVMHCLKKVNPVLDLIVFKVKTFRTAVSINAVSFALTAGVSLLLPLMYQEGFGFDAATSGLLTLPIAVGYLTFRGFANHIISNFGFKNVLQVNLILAMIWLIGIAHIEQHTSVFYIVVVEFLYGSSTILIGSAIGALTYMDLNVDQAANATSIDLTIRQFAASMGVALTAVILSSMLHIFDLSLFSPNAVVYHYSFYAMLLLLLGALIISLTLTKADGMAELTTAK